MKIPFTGGCVCGAIRYECSAEPIMMFKCHCRDCQQVTGGGFVAGLLVPASAFRLTKGQLRYHFTPSAAGGKHKRGFCAECGSRITGGQSDERPTGFVGVTAGSLDDSSGFRPQMDFFVSDAQPWDQMEPAIHEIRTLSAAAKEWVKQCPVRWPCGLRPFRAWKPRPRNSSARYLSSVDPTPPVASRRVLECKQGYFLTQTPGGRRGNVRNRICPARLLG